MFHIIIEHCFFGHGKHYDASISSHYTEQKAELERELFILSNPSYKHHSIIIREVI